MTKKTISCLLGECALLQMPDLLEEFNGIMDSFCSGTSPSYLTINEINSWCLKVTNEIDCNKSNVGIALGDIVDIRINVSNKKFGTEQ
jgi:hypothetical protein|tara:strand:- start:1169 stop:1432 length:264 start_codon:yes stop_codon:yes gene_type:complete